MEQLQGNKSERQKSTSDTREVLSSDTEQQDEFRDLQEQHKEISECKINENDELHERESKWGFTLQELQAATKVVRRLYYNPSLFVGDSLLADSRLYTMITRDRKTKRENREVYKAIMNEEKSRRQRYKRMQYLDTIQKTAMKRERESALNALMSPVENDTHLLQSTSFHEQRQITTATTSTISTVVNDKQASTLQSTILVSQNGMVFNNHDMNENYDNRRETFTDNKQHEPFFLTHSDVAKCKTDKNTLSLANCTNANNYDDLRPHEVVLLRLIGAFENLLRLEEVYERQDTNSISQYTQNVIDQKNSTHGVNGATKENVQSDYGKSDNHLDWLAITQLTAQYYRYIPHAFGSQMPPPLFPGPISVYCEQQRKNDSIAHQNENVNCLNYNDSITEIFEYTIAGAKLRLAERLDDMHSFVCVSDMHSTQHGTHINQPKESNVRDSHELNFDKFNEMEIGEFCTRWLQCPSSSSTSPASSCDGRTTTIPEITTEVLIIHPICSSFTTVDSLRAICDPHFVNSTANDRVEKCHEKYSKKTTCDKEQDAHARNNTTNTDASAIVCFIELPTREFMAVVQQLILEDKACRESEFNNLHDTKSENKKYSEVNNLSPAERFHVAMQSLNVFIARRLYSVERLRCWGASPVVIEHRPPVAEDEEPDEYNVFDEVQQYAIEHDENSDKHDKENEVPITNMEINESNRRNELLLEKWVSCHTCKVRYNRLHPFYYSMCHLCGEYNYNKRLLSRDLRGKVVLITGCRIKIGYAMTLSLLRCGATVLGLTRFIHEAVARFQQEKDYHVWQHRLHLFSIDLRDLWIVTQFCAFVQHRFPKLFAIINNATQTIARTAAYTAHLRAIEAHPATQLSETITQDSVAHEWFQFFITHTSVKVGIPSSIESHPRAMPFMAENVMKTVKQKHEHHNHHHHHHHHHHQIEEKNGSTYARHAFESISDKYCSADNIEHAPHKHHKLVEMLDDVDSNSDSNIDNDNNNNNKNKQNDHSHIVAVNTETNNAETNELELNQHEALDADEEQCARKQTDRISTDKTIIFDRYDMQAEESDLREQNSWVLKLAQVHGSEAAEVMAINALAPFIINSKLKVCLLNRHGDNVPNEERFIINVSAMEGQFYRYKQTTHPHTNMAKAALNMMTRTSGEDYAADGIFMNSVDTGWITDESPKIKKNRRAEQHLLCPLDEIDAAARCLDLIYTNSHVYGKFYKDYKEIAW